MTRNEILKIPAGRETDAMIAVEIMKLDLKHLPTVYEEGYTSDGIKLVDKKTIKSNP